MHAEDTKRLLVEELRERLGSFAVSVRCAQIDDQATAQAAYADFVLAASGPPSRTTSFVGEILANDIDERTGPVVGILSHDLSVQAQHESFDWFAAYACNFRGLSTNEMWSAKDRNAGELMALPLVIHEFHHHD